MINPPEVKTIQVGPVGALTFDPAVIRVKAVEGVNGFRVLAATIDNLTGRVQFATGFPGGALGPVGPRVKRGFRLKLHPGDHRRGRLRRPPWPGDPPGGDHPRGGGGEVRCAVIS